MQNVQQYGVNSYKYFSYDVLDFFRELGRKSGVVKTTDLNEAIASVQSALNQAVIAKDCLSGVDYDFDGLVIVGTRFCGIGMYIPKEVNDYVPDNISWNNWNSYYELTCLIIFLGIIGIVTTSNPSLGIMRQVGLI